MPVEELQDLVMQEASIDIDAGQLVIDDPQVEVKPPSPTVFECDRWNYRHAELLLEDWKSQGVKDLPDLETLTDAHTALFEAEPRFSESPEDMTRAAWMRALTESPQYKALHGQTCLDPELSGIASNGICTEYAKYVATVTEKGNGEGIDPNKPNLAEMRSVAQALQNSKQSCEEATDIAAGLGMGGGTKTINREEMAKAMKRIKNSKFAVRVMAMAGKMRSRASSLQHHKLKAQSGEIVGLRLGRDISHLVPRERLALAGALGQEAQDRAEHRLLRGRALCYSHKQKVPVGAGPIIVSVDESGSMSGDKIVFAKALALTMGWLAFNQRRWIALSGFSDGLCGTIALPPGSKSYAKLLDWVEQFDGGGTTLTGPCVQIPAEQWPIWLNDGLPRGRTDHIIITDAAICRDDAVEKTYREWAESEKVVTYGIAVGVPREHCQAMEALCQRFWCIPKFDLDADAISEVLSI